MKNIHPVGSGRSLCPEFLAFRTQLPMRSELTLMFNPWWVVENADSFVPELR